MAMAVALLEPEFASKILEPKDDGCGIISETGIILGAEDVEEFIVAEIEKLHVRNQRANTKSVCKALAKSHGLTTRVVSLQLKRMILTGRIEKRFIRGRESFKLGTEVISSGNEPERKVSNDEEKAVDHRNDLVKNSSRQDGAEDIERADISEYGSEADSSQGELKSSQDENETDNDEVLITTGNSLMNRMKTTETEYDAVVDKDCHLNSMEEHDMKRRLSILERKVDALTAKIPTGENENKEFKIMLEKIGFLERENEGLKDENSLLKNEIRNLRVVPNPTISL
eukprot:Seg5594.3 transcript_id=Seg5594.3/GoldUCD/mRNA.D3Y31 product="hypothetical protein" protein_id=Seg5594.3/GoldUCD/D3Y31